ncbi:Universal stress protein [Methanosarcina horonobensis HB-1 = JCM 15518]|uniref:Universal stress protein n=1 Tax=Methanosarcina horonobensis HB-1 = JCM 15518 TaxID=1434110 RepID=A0A0E3S8T9_9EURY|nr:universal stress protein [Methanosarcina horonobensis]AKB77904.1 Universal stress protein [Methanosarcina horonobensis HB-1 = JCM 15518]
MKTVNFKKIMIATDGSVCSRMAANNAIELARLSGGTVYAVYVVSTDYFSSMAVDLDWERMREALKKEGNQAVNYVTGIGEMEGVRVEPVLLEGHPADELIRYAEEEGMDIVVMGTLGKTGLDRLFLGSVAGNMVRNSKVPVMVVKEKRRS